MKTNLTKKEINILLKCGFYILVYLGILLLLIDSNSPVLMLLFLVIFGGILTIKLVTNEANKIK